MNQCTKERFRLKIITAIIVLFSLVAIGSGLLFAQSYRRLNESIQNERAEAVGQIGTLISQRVMRLKQAYISELESTVYTLEHAGFTTFDEVRAAFSSSGSLIVLNEDASFQTLAGEYVVFSDAAAILRELTQSNEPVSLFSSIHTKGDYWLFCMQTNGVVLGGKKVQAIIRAVDAQEFSSAAAMSIYDAQGASYVVSAQGSILMRPVFKDDDDEFSGYNLLSTLRSGGVPQEDVALLEAALAQAHEAKLVTPFAGNTWMIQCVPSEDTRSIVVAVPISITAQNTFSQMKNAILYMVLITVSLGGLLLITLISFYRRNQATRLVRAKATAKSDFMSKMSHDIRTPLSGIIGMLDLANGALDNREELETYLSQAMVSSKYLVSLINDVLDMSRIESGKMSIASEPFSMAALLECISQMEEVPAREKGVALEFETCGLDDFDFIGDSMRIQQIVMNLVSNAIKFTSRDGNVRVSLSCDSPGNGEPVDVHLVVSDTGMGMSEEFMQKLFSPFEQERSSLTQAASGSGLGLSIVKSLVDLMNGTIDVKSTLGKGSTFTICLPLEATSKAARKEQAASQPQRSLSGKRVLLVEDHALNRMIISRHLQKSGIVVDEAENGKIALDSFTLSPKGYYALILMDIMMPVMGGLEAARAIRTSGHADAATVPIIALSANAYVEDAEKSRQAGMQAHLAKPVDVAALNDTLNQYIK